LFIIDKTVKLRQNRRCHVRLFYDVRGPLRLLLNNRWRVRLSAECLFVNDGTLAHANTRNEVGNGAVFVLQICTNVFDRVRLDFPCGISIFRLSFDHILEICANSIDAHLPIRHCYFLPCLVIHKTFGIIWNDFSQIFTANGTRENVQCVE